MPSALRLPPSVRSAIAACLTQFEQVERTRGSDGTFAPESEGGPDPLTMKKAYGPPKVKKAPGVVAPEQGVERAVRWRVR